MNWENKAKTAGCFAGFLLGVYFLEPWMITLGLLIPFIKNMIVLSVTGGWKSPEELEEEDDELDDHHEIKDKTDKENEKKSLKEKMQAMQEITLMVSNMHTEAKSNFWSIYIINPGLSLSVRTCIFIVFFTLDNILIHKMMG